MKKEKSDSIVLAVKKSPQKMKNKSLLSIEKNIIVQEKTIYYNYQKVFLFKNICFFTRKNIKNFDFQTLQATLFGVSIS